MAGAIDVSLHDIVAALGGELVPGPATAAPATLRIDRIASLEAATPSTICYLANPRLKPLLAATRAGCVIVAPVLREEAAQRGAAIVTPDPHLYFARLTQWWIARIRPPAATGVHPSAVVDPTAVIGHDASIGPLVVVEADAHIGDRAVIGAGTVIGRGASVGAGTRLAANVTLGAQCHIGARGLVHSGAVIGADGFGFAPDGGRWEKIEQLGGVRIGDEVEIGANTCIDRGALDDTVIGDGVKLDNLIQLGHNVRIGDHTAIAGCVGIAGSTVIGKHCTVGGAAMMVGHIELVDHVHISGGSLVNRSIRKPGHYTGIFPIDENAAWEKNAATLRNLHALRDRVRALESALTRLNSASASGVPAATNSGLPAAHPPVADPSPP